MSNFGAPGATQSTGPLGGYIETGSSDVTDDLSDGDTATAWGPVENASSGTYNDVAHIPATWADGVRVYVYNLLNVNSLDIYALDTNGDRIATVATGLIDADEGAWYTATFNAANVEGLELVTDAAGTTYVDIGEFQPQQVTMPAHSHTI